MKAPRPSFTPSRHNVGAYEVRVRVARWKEEPKGLPVEFLEFPSLPGLQFVKLSSLSSVMEQGKVSADGSLSIEPEAWRARHYRRAVMRGAGVYQAGLWAFLAGQRVKHQNGAALLGNHAGTLARFESEFKPPPQHITQVIDMTPRAGEVTGRQRERAHGKAAANNYFFELIKSVTASALQSVTQAQAEHKQFLNEVTEGVEQAAKQAEKVLSTYATLKTDLSTSLEASLDSLQQWIVLEPSLFSSVSFGSGQDAFDTRRAETLRLIETVFTGALEAEQDEDKRALLKEIRRQVTTRLLRRLLPRFRRPQQPASVPRPLHARPRPPAAPLAPPAL